MVTGTVIEWCPLHGGSFNVRTSKALTAPVCVDLVSYPVKLKDGAVSIELA